MSTSWPGLTNDCLRVRWVGPGNPLIAAGAPKVDPPGRKAGDGQVFRIATTAVVLHAEQRDLLAVQNAVREGSVGG